MQEAHWWTVDTGSSGKARSNQQDDSEKTGGVKSFASLSTISLGPSSPLWLLFLLTITTSVMASCTASLLETFVLGPVLSPVLQVPWSKCHYLLDVSLASQTQQVPTGAPDLLPSHSILQWNKWQLNSTTGPLHWLLLQTRNTLCLHIPKAPCFISKFQLKPAPTGTPDLSYPTPLFLFFHST